MSWACPTPRHQGARRRTSGGTEQRRTGGGPGPAGMHAAEPVEIRADAAVGPGGGPGPADIKAATGVTVAADAGLGQSPAPARSSVDLGTTTMCTVRRGQGGVRADIRFRLTQTGVSGDITEYLLLQGS